MRGGTISVSVTGGLPGGAGLLVLSLSDGVGVSKLCPYLLGAPFVLFPLGLNGSGNLAFPPFVIPDLSSSFELYGQYFGFETGGPSGNLYATNGVRMPFFDY